MKIVFPTWLVILATLTSHAQSGDQSGAALLAALKSAATTNRAAIIHALGEQRVTQAVGQLSAWLKDSDPLIASSAARALGGNRRRGSRWQTSRCVEKLCGAGCGCGRVAPMHLAVRFRK